MQILGNDTMSSSFESYLYCDVMIMKGKRSDFTAIFELIEKSNISQFLMYANQAKKPENVHRNMEVVVSRVLDDKTLQINHINYRPFITQIIKESTCRNNHTQLLCEWELWL